MRILTDNPGQHFTQHFNDNFVSTVKRLLRDCRDGNVQQITRETLDYFEAQKLSQQPGLTSLMNMWTKEKAKGARFLQQPVVRTSDVFVPTDADDRSQYPNGMQIGHSGHGGHGGHRSHRHTRQLPPPDELAARIEEAKTTARLLIQTVQSTPQSELMANELVKEFAERARSAHKSVSNYMSCDNPPPDEDTMLTLIETNDQLNVAMSKHQRALLQARKAAGLASPTPPSGQGQEANNYMQASGPMTPHVAGQNVYGNVYGQPSPPHHQHPSSTISPVSPMNHNNETFSAPSGPPPRQIPQNNTSFTPPPGPPPSQFRQQTYEYEDAYAPAPHIPPANSTHNRSESRTTDYGVAENPFSDDNAAEHDDAPRPPPKSNPGALFGRSQQQQQQQQQPQPGMMASTPSYMQRQDSSANNLTMHGGSPPPENAGGR